RSNVAVGSRIAQTSVAGNFAAWHTNYLPHEAKNVTIKGLPCLASLLHLVCPHGQPRYYLLLTGIHRFLAPLFTSIPSLFEPQPLSYRHDSTQTRNSARVTK